MGSGGTNRRYIAGVCGLMLTVVVWKTELYRTQAAAPGEPPLQTRVSLAAQVSESYLADYGHFAELLGSFREGQDEALDELRLAARRLAEEHQRTDAPGVVDYFAELRPSERRLGLEASEEVNAFLARAGGRSSSAWKQERPELLHDLEAFVARVLAQADFTPAAHALALASEIRTDRSPFAEEEEEPLILRARRDALEALAIFDRAGMQTPKLRPMLQLGRLLILQSKPGAARQQFQLELELARRCRQPSYEIEALVALIRLARNAGDVPELERRLEQLAQLATPDESWELAREHAMLWIHRDQPARAVQFLLRHRPRQAAEQDVWRQVLATARLRMGEYEAARELMQRIGTSPAGDGEDLMLLRATLDLAQGDTIAVLERLGEAERVFTPRGRSRAATLVGEAQLREGHAALALDSLRRARALAESWEVRMEEAHPAQSTSASVLGEWLGLHAIVLEARALCDLGRELEAAVLIERSHAWRWRHETENDGPAQELTTGDLQAWAGQHELGLVTWVLGADIGLAIHITPGGQAFSREILVERRAVQRAVRRFRAALLHGTVAEQTQLGTQLREALLPASLELALDDGEGAERQLLLLAHGELEHLPFAALPCAEGVLDERACLLVLPELPDRRPGPPPPGPPDWSLLGDPQDADGSARLPAAELELRRLQALWPGARSVWGPALTSAACLEALSSGRALHVATHLARSPACRSLRFRGLALELSGSEQLCAETIATTPSASPLVVLAACETVEGRQLDARGLQGIARAFLDAGVRNLLVTLWPIRDDSAAQFSDLFHRALLGGKSPARAAQLARRALAQSGLGAADWAAYRVLGRD